MKTRLFTALLTIFVSLFIPCPRVQAHPLGQFTINHYARIETGLDRARIRYVVDFAEIATFQEIQIADTDSSGSLSESEVNVYLERAINEYLRALKLTAAGLQVPLNVLNKKLVFGEGAANLPIMRIEADLEGDVAALLKNKNADSNNSGSLSDAASNPIFRFENTSHQGRAGWHELVVVPAASMNIYNSTAYGSGITDELKAYPEDMLMSPLNERAGEWTVTAGAIPAGAKTLLTRAGSPVIKQQDRFAELIAVQTITPGFFLLALLIAFGFGGAHALSPGHGKTVVGAYLVGARGTAKHAAFLGLTVTITHTLGVFALGLVTLFASQYILPEQLFPILSITSGLIVLGVGLSLFIQRLRAALGIVTHEHSHSHFHDHSRETSDDDESNASSHTHSHLPPEKITWRNLLALGISGGLLPCPSALVVMLSAIALNRIAFGLILIVAFSLGLASVLTAIGLAFVYAGKFIAQRTAQTGIIATLSKVLPVLSSIIIAGIGFLIIWQSLEQAGINVRELWGTEEPTSKLTTLSVLTLGLILGLKHAIEADHLAAVTAIVSERKSVFSSTLVGGLWGVGHTIPILLVGLAVIILRIQIGERVGLSLEFCVGLMLIGLGSWALWRLWRGETLHLHSHAHGGHVHVHPHFHAPGDLTDQSSTDHASSPQFKVGWRPLFVGMMHGLAGSAALVPLVVAEISSPFTGMLYMLIFGLGSIGGMMLMSAIVGLPLHLTASRFRSFNYALRALAGVFSVGFGLFMVYEIGFREGLLR